MGLAALVDQQVGSVVSAAQVDQQAEWEQAEREQAARAGQAWVLEEQVLGWEAQELGREAQEQEQVQGHRYLSLRSSCCFLSLNSCYLSPSLSQSCCLSLSMG